MDPGRLEPAITIPEDALKELAALHKQWKSARRRGVKSLDEVRRTIANALVARS
jgi:hypothetical protein